LTSWDKAKEMWLNGEYPCDKYLNDDKSEKMTGIITFMINTFLSLGPTDGSIGNVAYVGNTSYTYKPCTSTKLDCYTQGKQYSIAITLAFFVVISVPIMLCVVPCFFREKGSKVEDALVEMSENE